MPTPASAAARQPAGGLAAGLRARRGRDGTSFRVRPAPARDSGRPPARSQRDGGGRVLVHAPAEARHHAHAVLRFCVAGRGARRVERDGGCVVLALVGGARRVSLRQRDAGTGERERQRACAQAFCDDVEPMSDSSPKSASAAAIGTAIVAAWADRLRCSVCRRAATRRASRRWSKPVGGSSSMSRLSEPPGTSCASCHDPARAFTGDNGSGLPVPRGSRAGMLGTRNTPTAMYLATSPGPGMSEKDGKVVPSGGFFWDGRAATLADQALGPLFSAHEMNNRDMAALVAKVAASDAAPLLQAGVRRRSLRESPSAQARRSPARSWLSSRARRCLRSRRSSMPRCAMRRS